MNRVLCASVQFPGTTRSVLEHRGGGKGIKINLGNSWL